ncbi:hypothetical protein PHMEG_00010230 [Phytophthora megakarya]|uniref:Elicitin n=1 Tax=Phytophthora megakarya TaxID=4795 RepID=A0A225WE62_9STRA|nr:hypothetical protein PHMEG_00010230 [Phytophthora megakarya]
MSRYLMCVTFLMILLNTSQYNGAEAAIVKSAAFEDGCVQVLMRKEAGLSAEQHNFLKDCTVTVAGSMSDEDDRSEFAQCTTRAQETTSCCSSLSRGCHVLSLHRHGVLPLEMLLFLKVNMRFGGVATVSMVVNA